MGLYKVALADGKYEKIGKDGWSMARGAVYLPEEKAVCVLHGIATYKVQLADGACSKLTGSAWACVKGIMSTKDPKEILAFHDWGLFK
eukprot:6481006-Amphidinium_carterae.1